MQLKSPFGPTDKNVPQIRSIDYSAELDRILVGTNNCDVCEVGVHMLETYVCMLIQAVDDSTGPEF